MADEERPDESTEQPDAEEQPSQEPSAEEPPTPEEQPAPEGEPAPEEPPAEAGEPQVEDDERSAPDGEPPAEEVAAPGEPAEEPTADEVPAAPDEPAAASQPAREAKKPDVVPGAELEPIALEPERELDAEERARLEAEEEERARREAEAEAAGDQPVARSGGRVEIPADAAIQATGKRKSSIARVVLRRGDGSIQVNDRTLEEYFPRQNLRTTVRQPLLAAGYEDAVEIRVRVHGGGISGQAGAVRHGIARALTEVEPELRSELKRRGLLTRDARAKERRKAGLKKARKKPQFSKR